MPRFCFRSKFARVISQSRINWKSTFFPLKNYKSALLKLAQKSPQTTASGSVPRSWGGPRTSWRTARCPPAKCKPIAPARSRATSRTSLSGEQAARLRGAAREGCPPLPPQKKKGSIQKPAAAFARLENVQPIQHIPEGLAEHGASITSLLERCGLSAGSHFLLKRYKILFGVSLALLL